jgi:sec-independent protein translocase protein TatB
MSLFEILIIVVVALLVFGPERMPEVVRSVALTIGRIKRMLQNARSEFEEHIGADAIRQQLHNEEIMANEIATREEIEPTMREDSQSSVGNQQINSQISQYDHPSSPSSKTADT